MSTVLAKKTATAFIIGGHPGFVTRSFRAKMAAYGVAIPDGWHLSMDDLHNRPSKRHLPEGCELLIVLAGTLHNGQHANPQREEARAAGIPIVESATHKTSLIQKRLLELGFEPINANVAHALGEDEEEHAMDKSTVRPVTGAIVPSGPPKLPDGPQELVELLGAIITKLRDNHNVDGVMWAQGDEKVAVTQRCTLTAKV